MARSKFTAAEVSASMFSWAQSEIRIYCLTATAHTYDDSNVASRIAAENIEALMSLNDSLTDAEIDAQLATTTGILKAFTDTALLNALATWQAVETMRRTARSAPDDDARKFGEHALELAEVYSEKTARFEAVGKFIEAIPLVKSALPPIIMAGLDGWLKVFVDHVVATSRSPQPYLALGAALCAMSGATGRRFKSETNIRTNLMVVCLADSGAGKERPLSLISDIFVDAKMDNYIGGSKIASETAIISSLRDFPVRVFPLDEIGHLFAAITNANAKSFQSLILPTFTEIWSKSQTKHMGTAYANTQLTPRKIVHNPHLVLFGVTVAARFWKAFNSSATIDGSLARFLIFETPQNYPDEGHALDIPPPAELIDGLRAMAGLTGGEFDDILPQMSSDKPAEDLLTVRSDADAQALFKQLKAKELSLKRKHEGTSQSAIWARLYEQTMKVAMLKAISRDHLSPVINGADAEWAEAVVMHSLTSMVSGSDGKISDNLQEANNKRVLEIIRKAGRISRAELTQKTRFLDDRQRIGIISSLRDGGDIAIEETEPDRKGGRPGAIYYPIQ